jgi:hypothetical protein
MRSEEFVAARLPALLRYATLLSNDRDEGHDIVQEVLTKALVKWGRIGTVDEPYGYVRPDGGGHLLIEAGSCTVQFISADRTKISRDDLTAMAATATYAVCTDPSTWMSTLD